MATWILWLHILAAAVWLGGAAVILVTLGPAGPVALDMLRRARFLGARAMEMLVLTGILNVVVKGVGAGFAFQAGFFAMLAIKMAFLVCMAGLQIWMGLAIRPADAAPRPAVRRARLCLGLQFLLGAVASLLGLGLRAV